MTCRTVVYKQIASAQAAGNSVNIVMQTNSLAQAWSTAHPSVTTPVTAKTTTGQNSRRSALTGIDGFKKRKDFRRKWITTWEKPTNDPGSENDNGGETGVMMDWTDKEYEKYRGRFFHKWGAAFQKQRFVILTLESTDVWGKRWSVEVLLKEEDSKENERDLLKEKVEAETCCLWKRLRTDR